jgi:hypothetical protein
MVIALIKYIRKKNSLYISCLENKRRTFRAAKYAEICSSVFYLLSVQNIDDLTRMFWRYKIDIFFLVRWLQQNSAVLSG